MALTAVPIAGKRKAADICAAFIAGAPPDARGSVFYGVNETNVAQWEAAQRSGEDWYYIDNSYFDKVRAEQFRVTKNRLQVPANAYESDGKRFDALGIQIRPWHSPPLGYWLVIEQSPSFMQLVAKDPDWLARHVGLVGTYRAVKFRPWDRDKRRAMKRLPDELKGAWGLIAHTSAAAVTAAIGGVPIIVDRQHALSGLVCGPNDANRPDERRRLLSVLADNQWSLDEMRQGKAWAWLNR